MDGKEKILIGEDDVEDRLIINASFEELGLSEMIRFETDGKRLIAYLDSIESGQLPSLIILDLNMPILNGTEILQLIKDNPAYRHIPVIIFSTSINRIEMEKCMKIGALNYFTKPVKYNEYVVLAQTFYELATTRSN